MISTTYNLGHWKADHPVHEQISDIHGCHAFLAWSRSPQVDEDGEPFDIVDGAHVALVRRSGPSLRSGARVVTTLAIGVDEEGEFSGHSRVESEHLVGTLDQIHHLIGTLIARLHARHPEAIGFEEAVEILTQFYAYAGDRGPSELAESEEGRAWLHTWASAVRWLIIKDRWQEAGLDAEFVASLAS